MKTATQRGEGDIFGFIALAVFALVVYGLWVAGASLWKQAVGSAPAKVECYAGSRELYSGLTVDGVSTDWKHKTVTEYGTGKTIRLDKDAVCVEQMLSEAEAKELRALSAR